MPAIATFIFITLPWLNPFSPGPTAQVTPLLFSWACAAGVLLALAFDPQRGQNLRMVRALALAWAVAAGVSAVIGLMQYFGTTAAFGVWIDHTAAGQAFGNLRQRNQFATLLNIGLAATLWLAAERRLPTPAAALSSGAWVKPGSFLVFSFMSAVLLGAANAASSSRTGLFQLLLMVLLTLWWQRHSRGAVTSPNRRLQLVVLTALASYLLAMVVLPEISGLDPLTSGALARLRAGDPACSSRLTLWGNVLHLIGQKPWLGWGWGELDYAHFITLYPGTRFCDILDNAHNLPLHLAVELGVPLALLVCGVGVWLTWRAQPWREGNPSRHLAWGILAVIGLHSLLEYPLWYGPFQSAAVLSLWLLWWVPGGQMGSIKFNFFRPAAPHLYASAALLLIAYCGIAEWNYYVVSQIYLDPEERAPTYRSDTLAKIKGTWLYQDTARFAELITADLGPDNAAPVNALAKDMLHFSPEARVAELLLNSAKLLGRSDEVAFYAARYQAAFPQAYQAWLEQNSESLLLQ